MKKRTNKIIDSMNKAPKGGMRFMNLKAYDAPVISEQLNRGWINYGEDNDYFQSLIDKSGSSPG